MEKWMYDLRLVSLLEHFQAFLNHIATELLHGQVTTHLTLKKG